MSGTIGAIGFTVGAKQGQLETLRTDLRAVADMGADAAEIAVTTLDVAAGGRIIEERVEALVEITKSFGLRYTVHGLVCGNFMDPETVIHQVRAAKALVEICDRVGARVLVHHAGMVRADQPSDRAGAVERQNDALRDVADVAQRYGVRLALENIFTTEPGQYRQTPTEVAAAVRQLAHPSIVALIDFSHAYIESTHRGLDFRAELRAMAPVAGHLHVHDSFGQPAGRTPFFFPQEATLLGLGDLHMPLGWGDIPWHDIFAELTFLADTTMIMEVSDRYQRERPACLRMARDLADRVTSQAAAA